MKLIHAFLQTIDEDQLEFHKEEYFRIAMIHNELIRSRELVDFEVEVLENKRANIAVARTSIHELLQHRADVFQIKKHQDLAVVVERIDNQSKLLVEMIEAIESAVDVEKLLKQAEKIWDKEKQGIRKMNLNEVQLFKINLTKLSKLQNQIIEIHRRYIILQAELNDILSHLSFIGWEHHRYSRSFISDFEKVILDDIKSTRTPKSTENFLHSHKTHVRRILTTLRSDRDKTRRLVTRLKKKRDKLIQE